MSLLDKTKSKYKDRQHQNPLANENIKLQKLPPVTVRLQAEQHSQIQALPEGIHRSISESQQHLNNSKPG